MIKQLANLAAIGLIGEGAVGLMAPRRYTASWRAGPEPVREWVDGALEYPRALRGAYVSELAAGLLLAAFINRE